MMTGFKLSPTPTDSQYYPLLKGTTDPIKELDILEIGGDVWGYFGVVQEGLVQRKTERLTYHNMSLTGSRSPDDNYSGSEYLTWAMFEAGVKKPVAFQKRHNARDIPYPYANAAFDEVHCHLLDTQVVRSVDSDSRFPTIDDFATEISRITKPHGRFFFTAQAGFFFDSQTGEAYCMFEQHMNTLNDSLSAQGFIPLKFVPDTDFRPGRELNIFTAKPEYVDGFLIAEKK